VCQQVWSSIAARVLEIELMREFVQHEILTITRRRRAATNRVPRENQRAQSMAGVAEAVFAALFPNASADVAIFVRRVARRIHDDRDQLRVILRLAMEQEHARLASNRDTNLFSHLESTGALEMLFRHEHLHVAEQLGLVFGSKTAEDGEIALENGAPRTGGRLRTKARAAPGFEEVQKHD
jgi:hypothetical protein